MFVSQWSLLYSNSVGEQAVIRVRFSEQLIPELIEFQVFLDSVPIGDEQSKSITANWKMYNDFDGQGQFWTDSNGFRMIPRKINKKDWFEPFKGYNNTAARNFYPVNGAITMVDKLKNGKQTQVTIFNDRAQAGTAGWLDKGTIELMQHRR